MRFGENFSAVRDTLAIAPTKENTGETPERRCRVKILLVEDSERLQRSIGQGLTADGHAIDIAADGDQGLELAETYDYDVIILDLMLPKLDGLSVLKHLRQNGCRTHILILSARDQTDMRVKGLDLGADDYMVKPFSFDELKARMRALHRRSADQKDPCVRLGDLELDTNRRMMRIGGQDAGLSAKEYELVEFLARRRQRIFPQQTLIETLYDSEKDVTSNVIEALVYSIRRKLAGHGEPSPIRNRRGQGYFVE